MSDFEDIQNLIRLKRHEQPSPDFVDDFVHSFQQRQRAELLNNSARGLLWERVTTYFDGLFAPKWAMAGAAAVAMLGTAIVLRPASQGGSAFANNGGTQVPAGTYIAPISDEEVRQYLLSRHYQGGFGDERERRLVAHDQMAVSPVGFKLDVEY
ncbi:hypothetical protein [Verrucomicrobium sp. BvORR034]|uniref:hypothetical protein n=1 Tax=Verrucomicrobium sp. BvORR034 TaxID=1396418 RepID=UPI000679AF0B|nr:hypothetical protein [Verrucomicrobium sp. BvORR034]